MAIKTRYLQQLAAATGISRTWMRVQVKILLTDKEVRKEFGKLTPRRKLYAYQEQIILENLALETDKKPSSKASPSTKAIPRAARNGLKETSKKKVFAIVNPTSTSETQ